MLLGVLLGTALGVVLGCSVSCANEGGMREFVLGAIAGAIDGPVVTGQEKNTLTTKSSTPALGGSPALLEPTLKPSASELFWPVELTGTATLTRYILSSSSSNPS